jgi:hypothetical protein
MNNSITAKQHRFNLQNATFAQIKHADVMVATIYKITRDDGTSLILKCVFISNFGAQIITADFRSRCCNVFFGEYRSVQLIASASA